MITKKEFLNDFGGHGNTYSSYKVLTNDLDAVIAALNEINPEMCVGSGVVEEGAIYFEICKEGPDLIYDITAKLHCVGFADMGAWYGQGCFEAAKNGKEYDGFYAEWRDDCPYDRYEEGEDEQNYDVFVTVVDRETKITFPTGEGAACTDALFYWTNLVNEHPKDKAKKLKDDFIPMSIGLTTTTRIFAPGSLRLRQSQAETVRDTLPKREVFFLFSEYLHLTSPNCLRYFLAERSFFSALQTGL